MIRTLGTSRKTRCDLKVLGLGLEGLGPSGLQGSCQIVLHQQGLGGSGGSGSEGFRKLGLLVWGWSLHSESSNAFRSRGSDALWG